MPRSEHQFAKSQSPTRHDVDSAIAACRLRGAQMTPLRQTVLSALWSADRPLGAYDLRDRLAEISGRQISAPSIYRTLDFLCEQGVAARIESRNAYVACIHPDHEHACVFLVCESCGDAVEIENPKVERLINEDAKRLGFAVKHRVLELSGFCAPCQKMS
ncbi:MAG: Fur family transcriptional regulator [Pseudomonadota bacterium]